MRGLAVLIVAMFGSPPLLAQLPDRVIHLWVDPHYGDDTAASTNNPANPVNVQWSSAVLLHKSWPFKTIGAAISAIPSLPYAGTYANWTHAIIHALPGMYQRTPPNNQGPLYQHNGLAPNGETFPIRLPNYVSVQGTSALNTMFDLYDQSADAGVGPAFQFGASAGNAGAESFVDSVSIFGAELAEGNSPASAYAGIYLGNGGVIGSPDPGTYYSSSPKMSNCFIFGNGVGVAVDAGDGDEYQAVHTPTLLNNTIAWNKCGLWNGQALAASGSQGVSLLALINNIFDATPVSQVGNHPLRFPLNWTPQGETGFEGVALVDLQVLLPVGGGSNPVDFNAYEEWEQAKKFNRNWSQSPQYPVTIPRTGFPGPSAPDPTRNIALYTGWRGGQDEKRGVLYIRDLFYNAFELEGAMPPYNSTITYSQPRDFADGYQFGSFDLSPGDFRLCPSVADAGLDGNNKPWAPGDTTGPHGGPNPLIDNGWSGSWPASFTISMANGRDLDDAPGPLPRTTAWPFTCWDHDCEGYGNPRVIAYRCYSPDTESAPLIDIGADEAGELIIAGYRFGTTHFQVDKDRTSGYLANRYQYEAQNHYLFFLGPAASSIPQNAQIGTARPYYTWPFYETFWDYQTLYGVSPYNRAYYWPGRTDVIPHLLPDVHPWWPVIVSGYPGPTNPIWDATLSTPSIHNPALYMDPTAGTINPPGSATGSTTYGYTWLDFTFTNTPTVTQFGINGTTAIYAGPVQLSFVATGAATDWCMPTPSTVFPWDDLDINGTSMSPGPAGRFSLELGAGFFGAPTNLQSFMVWKRE